MIKIHPKIKPPENRIQFFFLFCLFVITIANLVVLGESNRKIHSVKKVMSHQMSGYQFYGLKEYTENFDFMGYYTDADLEKDEEAAKLFSHAQFVLAPTILELNNLSHQNILFVCQNRQNAIDQINKHRLKPIRGNKYGMLLTQRTR